VNETGCAAPDESDELLEFRVSALKEEKEKIGISGRFKTQVHNLDANLGHPEKEITETRPPATAGKPSQKAQRVGHPACQHLSKRCHRRDLREAERF
jgi:hypothetical protein